jgi:phosphatidylglycerophosphatase A
MKIKKILHPTWAKRIPKSWILLLATLGPVGNKLLAPGTWASLVGLGFYAFCLCGLSFWSLFCLSALYVYVAIPICDRAEHDLQTDDPDCIVLDEFVAMPICFLGFQEYLKTHGLGSLLFMGFILFRYFDIWKPLGIYKLQDLPGGLGIVMDDVVAALATNVLLHAIFHYFG